MLYEIINAIFLIYTWMLIIRVVSSWFPQLQESGPIRFIQFYTDPYLNLFRRVIPPLGMLDISPLFAFLALQAAEIIIKSFFK